jgi:hypothetical protein
MGGNMIFGWIVSLPFLLMIYGDFFLIYGLPTIIIILLVCKLIFKVNNWAPVLKTIGMLILLGYILFVAATILIPGSLKMSF